MILPFDARRLFPALGVLLVLIAAPVNAAPTPSLRLVAFGDSLLDSGNVYQITRSVGLAAPFPPSADPYRRYWAGRFSNGPTVGDYLAARLCGAFLEPSVVVLDRLRERCAVSFAFGGGTSGFWSQAPGGIPAPGFRAQVELLSVAAAGGSVASAEAVYLIWVGADDYLYERPAPRPRDVVANMRAGITRLHQLGARRFVLLNLPDLGRLPATAGTTRSKELTRLAREHNALLDRALVELRATFNGADLRRVDAYALMQSYAVRPVAGPAAGCLARFLADTGACRSLDPGYFYPALSPPRPIPDLFWDDEHPSTQGHRLIFEAVLRVLF